MGKGRYNREVEADWAWGMLEGWGLVLIRFSLSAWLGSWAGEKRWGVRRIGGR